MTESERLQKLVHAQTKEIGRLRRALSVVRTAHSEFDVTDGVLHISITAVGVDEFHFIEKARTELESVAKAITDQRELKCSEEIKDLVTGEVMDGGINPDQQDRA